MAGNDTRRVQQDLDTVQHLYRVAERHQDAEVLISVTGCPAASLKDPDGLIHDTPEYWPTQLSDVVTLDLELPPYSGLFRTRDSSDSGVLLFVFDGRRLAEG